METAPKKEESEQIKKLRKRIRQKSLALAQFLNSSIGKAVLEALEEEFFNGNIFDPDPYISAYNLGKRDVVVYLHELQRQPEKEDDAPGTT